MTITRDKKVLLGLLVAVLVVLISLYSLVNAVYVPKEEAVVYPASELVDSVFVAQNNNYEENSALKKTHSFSSVPYLVDVPDGTGAQMGTGTVYQIGDGFFAYVSEYTDQYDVQDIVSSQFPVALLINYIPENTRITIQSEEHGYINGFLGKYIADQLYVTDNMTSTQAIVIGYDLDMPEGIYSGNHIFVACGTTVMSTEAANTCAEVLSAIMKTVRYDEKLDNEMQAAKENEKQLLAEQMEAEARAELESESGSDGATMTTVVGDEVTETIPIVVTDDYKTFTLNVEWTMNNPDAVLELFFPGDAAFASPLSQTNYGASFTLSDLSSGTYQLHVMNYQQCGEMATTISGETANSERE